MDLGLHIKRSEDEVIKTLPILREAIASGNLEDIIEILQPLTPGKHGGNVRTEENWYRLEKDLGYDCLKFAFEFAKRDFFTQKISWALPSVEVIDDIVKFANGDTILEVGCGRGLWAALIRTRGTTVIATDSKKRYPEDHFIEDVIEADFVQAVKDHVDASVLLCVWGSVDIEQALEEFKGDRFIIIGEREGCTSDIDDEDEEIWELEKTIFNPVWVGIHDFCRFFRRKS